jgi:5-methylthioadenosine/S-adenosylhomocysteine deaminase
MKNVDTLFINAIVLTMDEEYNLFRKGAVAVSDDKIIAVGTVESLLKEYSSSNIVDCNDKVLMPGLVNAHTHVPHDPSSWISGRPSIGRLADGIYDAC